MLRNQLKSPNSGTLLILKKLICLDIFSNEKSGGTKKIAYCLPIGTVYFFKLFAEYLGPRNIDYSYYTHSKLGTVKIPGQLFCSVSSMWCMWQVSLMRRYGSGQFSRSVMSDSLQPEGL